MKLSQWIKQQGAGAKAKLARATGLQFNTILYLVQGKHVPSPSTAIAISRATGGAVSILELLGPGAVRAVAAKPARKRKAARTRKAGAGTTTRKRKARAPMRAAA